MAFPEVLVDLVTAHIRSRPLTPAAVLATKRAGWRLLAGDGHDVAELTNDDVSVMEGGDVRSRFSELRLEAREGSADDLAAVTDRLLCGRGRHGADPEGGPGPGPDGHRSARRGGSRVRAR